MIGFNLARPSKNQYFDFLRQIEKGFEDLRDENLSLMLYGSFIRGDYIPGQSDIDAVIVLPDEFVTNKIRVKEITKVLNESAKKTGFPVDELFQICPIDIGNLRDGRFNSLTDDFGDYFAVERQVISGRDYTPEMKYQHQKTGDLSALSHNLRKTRQSLLFAEYTKEKDYPGFLKGFRSTLKSASRGAKQILHLSDGKLRFSRFSALEELANFFPELNTEPLKIIKAIYSNPSRQDRIEKNPEEVLALWDIFLGFFEETIQEYVKKFPIYS